MELTIKGDAYVCISSIKTSEILMLKESNKDALKVKDEDGQEIFALDYCEGKGKVGKYGVTFGGTTRDENGFATITEIIPSDLKTEEAVKDFVADKFVGVMTYLKKLEKDVPKAAKVLTDARKNLVDSISVG